MFMLINDGKLTSLLNEAESALGFSSRVRSQTEMKILQVCTVKSGLK